MKLVTSNKNKLKEFKRLMPDIQSLEGKDLKEVVADKDTVILHKVKELNQDNCIIDDTIIEIFKNNQWEELVDIKFLLKNLNGQYKARWITSLAYSNKDFIYVFRGTVLGNIDFNKDLKGMGFDNLFIPQNSNKSLYELNKENKKDDYSARLLAIQNLLKNKYIIKKNKKDLKEWTGKYQD